MVFRQVVGAVLASGLVALAPHVSFANPQNGTVVGGAATIGGAGKTLTVKQSTNRAIINWQSFSIGAGQTTRIIEPSAASAILNRVTGGDPSVLLGRLQSNGQVYLINPNGIVVGPNGVVDTRGGFIASTLNVPNAAFMQGGSLTFAGGSQATITNLGTIKTTNGDVALIALHVINGGNILAPDGTALLAGGNEVLYVPDGDSNVVIKPGQAPGGASVDNAGRISAASAQLKAAGSAYALAVNNTGSVQATGMTTVGGRLVLDGGDGDVESSGALKAPGGTATLTGGRVAVTGSIDVSAPAGGGTIAVDAANAAAITSTATLNANATKNGNGGHVSVKSKGATKFAGAVSATGGPQGGNGGTTEISGATVGFTGTVDLNAPKGTTGDLLFDPVNIDVVSGNAPAPSDLSGGLWSFAEGANQTQISVGAITTLLQSANLELQASNSLTFDTPTGTGSFVTLSSATTNTLTLTAPTIAINASISLPNGTLVFNWPDADVVTFSTTAQSITSAATAAITASTVQVSGNYGDVTLNGPVVTGSLQFLEPGFSALSITANNSANAIAAVSFPAGGTNLVQDIDVESSAAVALSGSLMAGDAATFVAGGDLTLQSGFALASGHSTVFASTGGVFDNLAGPTGFSTPNGKLRIYSSTNGAGPSGTTFNDGGIASGAPTQSGVTYPANPDTLDTVVEYFGTTSVVPTLTITAGSFNRLYAQPDPTFTASYSGGSGGGAGELTTLPSFRILQGSDVNAGTYTIVPFGAASTADLLRYVDGTLTVNPAPLLIAAQAASMTYGGTVPTFSASVSGFVNGDTSSLVSGLTVTSDAGAAPAAGTYTITPANAIVATPPGGVEPNYTITYQTAAFTVNPAPLNVSAVATGAVYGSAIPTFQLNFSGFVNAGDASTVPDQFAGVTTAIQGSPVGAYPITLANGNPNSNYTVTFTGANLTINPAALTITPNVSRLYGGALPAVLPAADFNGLVAGDTPASLTTQPTLNTAATVLSNVGMYGITASGAVDANYTVSYAPGTLTVTPAPLTITANSVSAVYGSLPQTFSASYSGLLNGDQPSVVTGLVFSSPPSNAGVGGYSIFPSGASAANYAISYGNGALSVTPAPLTISPSGTQTFGGTPSVTFSYSGFVNGDTAASLTTQPGFTTPAGPTDSVGFYPLFVSSAASRNYTISFIPGTLDVVPAPLTITAVDISRSYGVATFNDDFAYSGFVNGDNASTAFSVLPQVNSGSPSLPVGSYPLRVISGILKTNNYLPTYVNGTMTVNPVVLTIVANNVSATQDEPIPQLTATYTGFVNGETSFSAGFSLTTTATSASPAQFYPITLVGSDRNYIVEFTPGTLTLNPSPQETKNPLIGVLMCNICTTTTTTTSTPIETSTNLTLGPVTLTPSEVNLNTGGNLTVYGVNDPALLFGPEADTVLQVAINSGVLNSDIYAELVTNPAVAQAAILPLLYSHLSDLLAVDQSLWTPAQSQFVQDVINFINQQKQTAALVAENDYATWHQQQQASETAQMAGLAGPTWIMMSSMLASNPPIPPDSILQEAAAGVSMTGQQAANYTAIQAATTTLADALQQGLGTVPGIFASTLSTLYAARIAYVDTAETGSVAESLFALSPKLANVIFPKVWKSWKALYLAANGITNPMGKAAKAVTAGDVEEFASDSFKITSDASKVLQLAGPITEVIADVMQIGVSAAQYANLAAYNASFNAAIAADNTPVTIASLKAMDANNSTQVYDYLTNMLAGGNAVQPLTVAPSTPISVYESPPMPTVSYP